MNRREIIKWGGLTASAATLNGLLGQGCSGTAFNVVPAATNSGTASPITTTTGSTPNSCSLIPAETEGPYPAHDDNAINCLRLSGIVRSDIRASLANGGYNGTAIATGVPLRLKLTLVNTNAACAPLAGYVVYLWHCDINGKYSMYSSGVTQETYLRGVQQADANGEVTFNTIFPGCYDGRYPHIHFEIYPSIAQAVDNSYVVRTSQLTFPTSLLDTVYNLSTYSTSRSNYARTSLNSDMVFADGSNLQIANWDSGDAATGILSSMIVGTNG